MQKETKELKAYSNASVLFDFGKCAYSQLEIELDASFEEYIYVVVGEELKDGQLVLTPKAWRTFRMFPLVLKEGHHTYKIDMPEFIPAYGKNRPYFETPKECGGEILPFRYVQISHHYGDIICRRTSFYGEIYDDEAAFICKDYWIAQLWDFCRYSLKATSIFPCFLDGERERMPYEADAYIAMMTYLVSSAHTKIAKDTIDYFMENGRFTWPTEWHLFVPFIIKEYILYTGDTESLKRWLPRLPEKLLPQNQNGDGLIVQKEGSIVRDIVDWPETDRDNYEFGTPNFVPNAMLVASARTVAELTGDKSFNDYADKVRAVLRATMMKDGLFVDNPESKHTSLHTAMTALLFGIAEEAERPALMKIVESKGMACSVYGAQILLDAVFSAKMDAHGVYLLSKDDYRSWKNMLKMGSTITTEGWDDCIKPAQDWNHAWGAAAGNIIARRYCGIRPVAPGFSKFVAAPCSVAQEFIYRHPTPFGSIEVNYRPNAQIAVSATSKDGKTISLEPNNDGIYEMPSNF